MIPIKELKASYIKVLREAVPGMRIYSNEVEEGYETPSLFVQMIPLIFKQRETASITRSSYMFETTFLQYKKNDAEQLEIIEKIRDKLGDHWKWKTGRYLWKNQRFNTPDRLIISYNLFSKLNF